MTLSDIAADLRAPSGQFLKKCAGKTTFTGQLESLPYPDRFPTTKEAVEQMSTLGYVVFPGVLSGAEVAALRALMDEKGGTDDARYDVPGWCYNRQHVTDFWHEPRLLTYIDRPGLLETVRGVHDPGAHVTGGSLWTTGAGRAMGIHVDYQPFLLPESAHDALGVQVPALTSTAHYYLNDMTAELGPTLVIPGSHKAGRPPVDENTWHGIAPQAVMVKAGDVCLFRGDIWHGAWLNSSQTERRYMMQVHYGTMYIRKQFPGIQWEQFFSADVLAQATEAQRELLHQPTDM